MKSLKVLVLCPGKIPKTVNNIRCFTDVINYYLPSALAKVADVTVKSIPTGDNAALQTLFKTVDINYDAIVTLGLRYYSRISKDTVDILRSRFSGLLCQTHDGSRLDDDPVDLTFTFKNDDARLSVNPGWYARHKRANEYIGWAADPELNRPAQSKDQLRILVDHTNYGDNPIDLTAQVLAEIQRFVQSKLWQKKYRSISVRRFDSGCVVDVDFNNLTYKKYDKSKSMSITDISKEHSAAHIFCVTHPESVGLVVLETALAGAYIVTPAGFIPKDRLQTVRHYEWSGNIDWTHALKSIDINRSRAVAGENTWQQVAERLINALKRINNEITKN